MQQVIEEKYEYQNPMEKTIEQWNNVLKPFQVYFKVLKSNKKNDNFGESYRDFVLWRWVTKYFVDMNFCYLVINMILDYIFLATMSNFSAE